MFINEQIIFSVYQHADKPHLYVNYVIMRRLCWFSKKLKHLRACYLVRKEAKYTDQEILRDMPNLLIEHHVKHSKFH